MRKFHESPFSMIGTHAGMACPAEGHAFDHHVQAHFVDAPASVLLGRHDLFCPLEILREKIQCKAVLPVGDHGKELPDFAVLIGNDRQKRIEELVPHDVLVRAYGVNERRCILKP